MKVSFLLPNISLPTIGAAIRLAQLIDDEFDVQIVGPHMGDGVCDMYRSSYPVTAIHCERIYRIPEYYADIRKISQHIEGDIIVSFKAFATSLPVALYTKNRRGGKIIVYLDEWDGAIYQSWSMGQKIKQWIHHWHHPGEDIYCTRMEKLISQVDHVITTTSFLQKKFGGTILPLGVDADLFKPQPKTAVNDLKEQWELQEKFVIGFGGVVRPHKGLETYLNAIAQLHNPDIKMLIIGPRNEHVEHLLKHPSYASFLICIGDSGEEGGTLNQKVHAHMPAYLDIADMLLVPLGDGTLAQSQMPCKVFEAMAMGKPIIATDVSDLGKVLHGCGMVIPPNDVKATSEAISRLLGDAELAQEMGKKAREKCIREYSATIVQKQFKKVLQEC